MITITMIVCLLSDPTACRPEQVPFDGPLVACYLGGQFTVAEWKSTRPKWRVMRWRCSSGRDA